MEIQSHSDSAPDLYCGNMKIWCEFTAGTNIDLLMGKLLSKVTVTFPLSANVTYKKRVSYSIKPIKPISPSLRRFIKSPWTICPEFINEYLTRWHFIVSLRTVWRYRRSRKQIGRLGSAGADATEAINEIGIVAGAGAHRSYQLIFIDKNCHSAGEPTPRGRQLSWYEKQVDRASVTRILNALLSSHSMCRRGLKYILISVWYFNFYINSRRSLEI